MRAWIGLSILFLATPAWAQPEEEQIPVFADEEPDESNEGYPNQGSYPAVGCPGGCPTGMACSPDGVCEQVPSCAGGCPQGMVCSPDGVCEAGQPAPPPPPAPVCNCPTGFACTPARTCAPVVQTVESRRAAHDPDAVAKARRRSTFGFVSAGVVLALGFTAGGIRAADDREDCVSCFHEEMPILFGTALYLGVSGLLTYSGSRAARRSGGRGSGFLRIAGWITWIAGLVGLVAGGSFAAVDGSEPAGFIFGSAVLAALGPTFWAIDARIAASQADELIEEQPEQARHWSPSLRLMRDTTQRVVGGTLGATFEL